jgi:hypothetical protein
MQNSDEPRPERVEIVLVGWRRDGYYEAAVASRRVLAQEEPLAVTAPSTSAAPTSAG